MDRQQEKAMIVEDASGRFDWVCVRKELLSATMEDAEDRKEARCFLCSMDYLNKAITSLLIEMGYPETIESFPEIFDETVTEYVEACSDILQQRMGEIWSYCSLDNGDLFTCIAQEK